MEEEMISVIMTTFGVDEQLAQELFNKCGYNLRKVKRYLSRRVKEKLAPIKCLCCGRKLTDPKSIKRGYGDECYKRVKFNYHEDLFQ